MWCIYNIIFLLWQYVIIKLKLSNMMLIYILYIIVFLLLFLYKTPTFSFDGRATQDLNSQISLTRNYCARVKIGKFVRSHTWELRLWKTSKSKLFKVLQPFIKLLIIDQFKTWKIQQTSYIDVRMVAIDCWVCVFGKLINSWMFVSWCINVVASAKLQITTLEWCILNLELFDFYDNYLNKIYLLI